MFTLNTKTTHFNDDLHEGVSVVALDDTYTDNNGHEVYAFIWDGITCKRVKYLSGYTPYITIDINGTEKQKQEAALEWASNPDNHTGTVKDFFEAVVILKRSRKAKNGVELDVVGYQEAYFNRTYNRYVEEQIKVVCPINGEVWVSANCVKEIVRTSLPNWQ